LYPNALSTAVRLVGRSPEQCAVPSTCHAARDTWLMGGPSHHTRNAHTSMHATCHVWQCAPPASEPWQKRKQNKFFFASVLRVLNVMCATGMEHLEHSECSMPAYVSNRGHQIAAPCDRAAARVDAPSQDIRVRGGEMTRALLSALLRYHEAALRARTSPATPGQTQHENDSRRGCPRASCSRATRRSSQMEL